MAGLSDPELKEKVLTQAMLGTVKDLPTLLAFANAEESARTKHPSKEIAAMRQTNKKESKCQWCGQPQHGQNNSDRQRKCKAFGQKCNKCGKVNHFAVMCKQTERLHTRSNTSRIKTEINEISQQKDDNEGEVSGFLAAMITNPPSSPEMASPMIAALRDR